MKRKGSGAPPIVADKTGYEGPLRRGHLKALKAAGVSRAGVRKMIEDQEGAEVLDQLEAGDVLDEWWPR